MRRKSFVEHTLLTVLLAQVSAATSAADKPMTAQELRELLAQSKDAQDDEDCLMCGS